MVTLSPRSDRIKKLSVAKKVYASVKSRHKYVRDRDLYKTKEHWSKLTKYGEGDCEDFALTCRYHLRKNGWSKRELRMATCWDEVDRYHAVLLVIIGTTPYVMDNRRIALLPITAFPDYKWDKIHHWSWWFWRKANDTVIKQMAKK